MQKMRTVVQQLDCKCEYECQKSPTAQPLDEFGEHSNEIGEHCLNQDDGRCIFLYWQNVRVVLVH